MPCTRSIVFFEGCGHRSRIYVNDPNCTGRPTYTEFPRITQEMIDHKLGSKCPIVPANIADKADWPVVFTDVKLAKDSDHLRCPLCITGRPTRLSTVINELVGREERLQDLRILWRLIADQNDACRERNEHEERRISRRQRWTEDYLENFKDETPRCRVFRRKDEGPP